MSTKERKKKAAREKVQKEARKNYDRKRTEIHQKHHQKLQVLQKALHKAGEERRYLERRYNNATNVFNTAQGKHTAVMQLPSNKPWGKLPEFASHQGFLRVRQDLLMSKAPS